jgi:hypothetical protein
MAREQRTHRIEEPTRVIALLQRWDGYGFNRHARDVRLHRRDAEPRAALLWRGRDAFADKVRGVLRERHRLIKREGLGRMTTEQVEFLRHLHEEHTEFEARHRGPEPFEDWLRRIGAHRVEDGNVRFHYYALPQWTGPSFNLDSGWYFVGPGGDWECHHDQTTDTRRTY